MRSRVSEQDAKAQRLGNQLRPHGRPGRNLARPQVALGTVGRPCSPLACLAPEVRRRAPPRPARSHRGAQVAAPEADGRGEAAGSRPSLQRVSGWGPATERRGMGQPLPGDRVAQEVSSGGLPPPRAGKGGPGVGLPSLCSCPHKLPLQRSCPRRKGTAGWGPDGPREHSRGLGGPRKRAEGSS